MVGRGTSSLALAFVATLVAAPVLAHQSPAQRSVIVQAEDHDVALLVTWTAPSGIFGRLILAAASWGHSESEIHGRLKALMTQQALAFLVLESQGERLSLRSVDSKLILDRSSMARHSVTVLATASVPKGNQTLSFSSNSRQPTRIAWADRTSQAISVSSSTEPDTWLGGATTITLSWAKQ